jgi:hypothetical protein
MQTPPKSGMRRSALTSDVRSYREDSRMRFSAPYYV